jgi:hypothetical protein
VAGLAELLKKLILAPVSVSVVLLAGEVALRYRVKAYPFEQPLYVPAHLTPQDTTLRWRFSPGDGLNRLGLRNREVGPKAAGTYGSSSWAIPSSGPERRAPASSIPSSSNAG